MVVIRGRVEFREGGALREESKGKGAHCLGGTALVSPGRHTCGFYLCGREMEKESDVLLG